MTANDILLYFMELNAQADRTKTFLSPKETKRVIQILATKPGIPASIVEQFELASEQVEQEERSLKGQGTNPLSKTGTYPP